MSLLDDILHELPELTSRRDEVARVLSAMERAGPPPAALDDAFLQKIRTELMTQKISSPSHFFSFLMQQRTLSALIAVLAIAIILPTGYTLWKMNENGTLGTSSGSSITLLADGAFGDLSAAMSGVLADGKGGGGMGISESAPITNNSKIAAGETLATNSDLVAEPFPFEPTVYVYTYSGNISSYLTDATATVYERQAFGDLSGSALSDITSSFSQLNMNAFLSGNLTSFTLAAKGYMLSVDTSGNTWSMYKDWTSYVMPENWTPMTVDDLPSDATIIAAAQSFVSDWGIDVGTYGTPVIGEPEIALARSGAVDVYIPESATVIFPVMVDGQEVYPSWGAAPTGLRVTINLRDLNVTNAYDALSQSYNASSYDLTQDADLVGKLISGGGSAPVTYEGTSINEVIVPLNDPKRTLMEYSLYEDGQSRTLFVPALRFTLQDPSQIPWSSNVITVPLVKDIAETQINNGNGGVVGPMIK